MTAKQIPIDWPALAALPAETVKAQIGAAYYQATYTRSTKCRRKHGRTIVHVVHTTKQWKDPQPLHGIDRATHDTIARCDGCGQWTCAEKYQRVPHKCVDRYAEPHPDINRKDVA